MRHNKLKIIDITLERAKELTKKYIRTLQNNVIIMGVVAPMVTEGGIILGEKAHEEEQEKVNKRGMLVVKSPFKRSNIKDIVIDGSNPSAVYEGEHVLFVPNTPTAFTEVITTDELLEGLDMEEDIELIPEMYKKYVVLCIGVHNLSCVIDLKV